MSKIIKKFTRRVPKWKPRVKPIEQREATQEQIEALKITPSNTKISEYVLTLAHDVESLSIRSPLFELDKKYQENTINEMLKLELL